MPFNNSDYAVTLPNQISPSQVLQQGIQLKERQLERGDALAERQRQFNEREKDRQLANQYKNADLISEGTDLSKHLTGDTIANDIATQKLSQAMPQFVAMAKSGASPVDLQMAISKWKNNVVPALDNIKREFQLGDEAAKKMKELYPDLDTESFLTDFRKDIHGRTIDPKTGELVASHLVQPSSFQSQLTNPDFLSKYAKGNKNLVDAITNPKGADDASIPSGSQDSHDVYAAKIPHWKTPNYTQEDVVKGGGFLPKGFVPQLKTKGESLSMDKVPDLEGKGNSVMIAGKNDYNRFAENPKTNLELIAATRQMYPSGINRKGYDDFSDVEKEYAKRQVLYNQFENLDRSNFAYKSSLRPSRTNVNINSGAVAKQDAIDNNSGTLLGHLEDAITNNPITVKVPVKGGGWGTATWGDLGKSDLTEPFKTTVTVPNADNTKPSSTKSVPYDKYLVSNDESGDKKIYGVYYKRNANGEMTDKYEIQKEIPLERYTERLVKGTTPLKYRADVIKKNVEEVKGKKEAVKNKSEYTNVTETKEGATLGVKNGKWYNIKTGKVVELNTQNHLKDI
jgi:hypothetical protein